LLNDVVFTYHIAYSCLKLHLNSNEQLEGLK
jgi:hypothetical protein